MAPVIFGQQIIELLPVPGIIVLGPLPGDLRHDIPYGASVLRSTKEPEAAKALVEFLRSPAAAPIFKKRGLEPA